MYYVMLFDEVLHLFEQRNKNQTPNATASSLYNTIGDVVNEAATIVSMMAEQADDQEIIYHIYMGGQDVVPRNATHVRVDKSVKVIQSRAFYEHPNLVEFECHDGVDTIEGYAFEECPSLKRVKMPGVRVVEKYAFFGCEALTDVDCDKLETIGVGAFCCCKSLRSMNLPSVKIVELKAFLGCISLVDMTFGDKLESIRSVGDPFFDGGAFCDCYALTRITIPLKDGMITHDDIFRGCRSLASVDLVGGIHETISSLHLEKWRDEMKAEIGRINQILPNTDAGTPWFDGDYPDEGLHPGGPWFDGDPGEKARKIRMWIASVLHKMEHYKAEHCTLLKEAATTLELALWKSRLGGDNNDVPSEGDEKGRAECRNNCGADMSIIISNVLLFLKIE
jgi:hypothetical protein